MSTSLKDNTHITVDQYRTMYDQSIADPDTFWAECANNFLAWKKPW